MKKINYAFIVLLSVVLCGCRTSGDTPVKCKSYSEKDWEKHTLYVYEVDKVLFPLLDSVIMKTKEQAKYNKSRKRATFLFSTYAGISATGEIHPNPYVFINIINKPHYYAYGGCLGVFRYKKHNFYIDELTYEVLVYKTERTKTVTYINPEKYDSEPLDVIDEDLDWWYEYKDGQMINRNYEKR